MLRKIQILLPFIWLACSSSTPSSTQSGSAGSSGVGERGGEASVAGASGLSAGAAGASGVAGSVGVGNAGAGVGGALGSAGSSASSAGGASGASGIGNAGMSGAAGSSACSGVLCEDFELGQIDAAKWDVKTGNGGTIEVQSGTVLHGKYALHVHGAASKTDDYALIVSKNAPAALNATHYGRANFLITPKPLTSGHTQMVFAGVNGTGSANGPGPLPKLRYMEVANINGGWQIGFDLLDLSPLIEEVAYPAGSPQVPTMTWSCLEWEFSDAPDTVNFWVDGKAIGTFDDQHVSYPSGHTPGTPLYDGTSSGLIGGYQLFGFGFHDWHPNQPFDLYYDDIVLDTKRVGCTVSP